MKAKALVLYLTVFMIIGAVSYASYRAGLEQRMKNPSAAISVDASIKKSGNMVDPVTGKTVLYWHDPMVPAQRFDKPGKSPFMDMQLVPVYADSATDDGSVAINPRVQQNLGIRLSDVTSGSLTTSTEAVGNVVYNERELAVLQARANGYVEKLYVKASLDPVRKGQALAELYVPDLIAAQEDFLTAKRLAAQEGGTASHVLIDAARQRMQLAGMSKEQIRIVESAGKVQTRMIVVAPMSGVVTELGIREGMTIVNGALLFRINGLDTIWVNAEVPEGAMAQVHLNNVVEVRVLALPGVVFKGKVNAILPDVDPVTRTLKVRIELINPRQQLVPGMFVTVNFVSLAQKDALMIPSEAVIQTGKRSIAIVVQSDGKFSPVEIETGRESNGQTEILKGLKSGQKVVVSGQFLIDSEASLTGTALRMEDSPKPKAVIIHHGRGKVEAIDKDEITISHEPIPSLQWGAMTMSFKISASGLPHGIKVGDHVDFEIRPVQGGGYEIASIAQVKGAKP
jgi:Cu(I)/Ag(I) efflux system membrane fusion protein